MLDPVVLFFIMGVVAGLAKSDLRVPESFYNVLSIYLLLAIGIKGGMELQKTGLHQIALPALAAIGLGLATSSITYVISSKLAKLDFDNAVALSAHYGSVSAVTFAVAISTLKSKHIYYEEYMTVLLVMMEIPAIVFAIGFYKWRKNSNQVHFGKIVKEVFMGKSILLLTGGLLIGMYIQNTHNSQMNLFFFDLFKGFLSIFMLEMGIVASSRISDLRTAGLKVIFLGIMIPVISGTLGVLTGHMIGLTPGGCTVLGAMAASGSYIAAPAVVRIAIPNANPSIYLTSVLGVTFPINMIFGIELLNRLSQAIN